MLLHLAEHKHVSSEIHIIGFKTFLFISFFYRKSSCNSPDADKSLWLDYFIYDSMASGVFVVCQFNFVLD